MRGKPFQEDASFLLDPLIDRMAERLALPQKEFETSLVIGLDPKFYDRLFHHKCHKPFIHDLNWFRPHTTDPVDDDECLPFPAASFDLVVSFFHLHFVNDLPGVLHQIHTILKPDGFFLGILPGEDTLWELRAALEQAELSYLNGIHPRVSPFVRARDMGPLLQRAGFVSSVVDQDHLEVLYHSPWTLMNDLRQWGQGNLLMSRCKTPTPRTIFTEACRIYTDICQGNISATLAPVQFSAWSTPLPSIEA